MRVIDYYDKVGYRTGVDLGAGGRGKRRVLAIADMTIKRVAVSMIAGETAYHDKPYPLARALRHINRIIKERRIRSKSIRNAVGAIRAEVAEQRAEPLVAGVSEMRRKHREQS